MTVLIVPESPTFLTDSERFMTVSELIWSKKDQKRSKTLTERSSRDALERIV
jgi:hypothetical protein